MEKFIEKLSETLEVNLKGAVISDMRAKDESIIYCNTTFLEMTGYDEQEVVGRNCRFLQNDDRQQSGLYVLRSSIKAQKPCKVVIRNYKKGGELFFNRLSISPIFNDKNELTHFLGLQDDVTDIINVRRNLQETEEENEVLLAEVHHRVKNNLSVMSSLLELERGRKSEYEALEKSSLRIHSMSLIHEKLYQKDGLAYINISNFIQQLTKEKYLRSADTDMELDFDFDMADAELNINQAIPLSIIVSELFHNIKCHAYPNNKGGRVTVRLEKQGMENKLHLQIIDYGTGLSSFVQFDEPDTLGFTVVQTLLSQIEANAELMEREDIGLGVSIKIPNIDRQGSSQNWRVGAIP